MSAIRVWIADLKDIHPEGTGMSMIATNQPVVSKSDHDLAMQTLRAERDRLLKIVEYGAAIDNALFMRGEHVETYEARCRYLADRCRKLLAALTPAGGRNEK